MSDPTSAAPGSPASPDSPSADEAAPVVRIVRGNPTDDELAAAHAVIAAAIAEQDARGAERVDPPVDLWRRSARAPRRVLHAGPGAWMDSRGLRGC